MQRLTHAFATARHICRGLTWFPKRTIDFSIAGHRNHFDEYCHRKRSAFICYYFSLMILSNRQYFNSFKDRVGKIFWVKSMSMLKTNHYFSKNKNFFFIKNIKINRKSFFYTCQSVNLKFNVYILKVFLF